MTQTLTSKIYSCVTSFRGQVPVWKGINHKANNMFAARMTRRETYLRLCFCLHASVSTQGSLTLGWGTWHGQVLRFQRSSGHPSPFSSATQPQGIKLSQLSKKLDLMTPKQIH